MTLKEGQLVVQAFDEQAAKLSYFTNKNITVKALVVAIRSAMTEEIATLVAQTEVEEMEERKKAISCGI